MYERRGNILNEGFYNQLIQPFAKESPISYYVTIFILILMIVWIIMFLRAIKSMIKSRQLLIQCKNIDLLKKTIMRRFQQDSFMDGEPYREPEDIFNSYCELNNLDINNTVAMHIYAIFSAGWEDSKLELGELTKYTSNRLFSINNFLKGILSTFVIIGLFGTLIGISETLSKLQPLMRSITIEQNSVSSKVALNSMLSQLGNSFIPSILGVGCTILAVIVFSIYINGICTKVKSELDYCTLTIWAPKLMPSKQQQFMGNLELSQEQVKKSFEVAQRASEFAENMQQETDKLSSNITNANGILVSFSKSLNKFDKFSERFIKSVSSLTSFQQDIKSLYSQMVEQSEKFQSNIERNIKNTEEVQNGIMGYFHSQHKEMQELIKSLKCYEDMYIKQHAELEDMNKNLLLNATNVYKEIGTKNDEILKTIDSALVEKLRTIENTLNTQLLNIVDRFNRFDAPINRAAEKIEGTLETVVNRTEILTKELQREFIAQNQNGEEQVLEMKNLYERIIVFLEAVDKYNNVSACTALTAAEDEGRIEKTDNLDKIDKKDKVNIREDKFSVKSLLYKFIKKK